LDFLSKFPGIKHVRIVNGVIDVIGLYKLEKLETLILNNHNKQSLSFSEFPNLTKCYFEWNKESTSIFNCPNITHLGVGNLPVNQFSELSKLNHLIDLRIGNSKIESLDMFPVMTNLEVLDLSYLNKIENLNGIEKFINLKNLEFYNLSKLENITSISECVFLSKLSIENCKNILNIDGVDGLYELEYFAINNCSSIESLTPLINLKKLDKVFFIENTNVIDGDLSPLLNRKLNKLFFRARRHYSHKKEQLT
jgi:hypothetical protein